MMQDLTTIRFRNPSKSWLVYSLKLPVYKWLNKRVAHKTDRILTPTKFVRDDVVAFTGAKPDKFTVTYESADKISDKPEEVSSVKNQDFIMYVGQAAANKNLDRLVDAFAILKRSQPKLHLVLVGKLSEDKQLLKTYAESNNIKDVIFTDWVSEGEKRWLYEHAKAYVFPSLAEGFGLPGLEAMRYDLPVVSSSATCLPEVYQDGAHYFDPENTADIAVKIEAVLTDAALRKKLVNNAQRVAAGYSWQRMAQQTLDVFNDVLTR